MAKKDKLVQSVEFTDAEVLDDDTPASTGRFQIINPEGKTQLEKFKEKQSEQLKRGNEQAIISPDVMPAGALSASKGGRPTKLDDTLKEKLVHAFTWADTSREVCAIIGIQEAALNRWRKQDKDLDERIECAKMTLKHIAKKKFIQGLANGGFHEAQQALAILDPDNYNIKTKLDITQKHTAEGSLADIIKKIQSGEIQPE